MHLHQICRKKNMKDADYEKLCLRMMDSFPGLEVRADFSLICMSAGVSSDEADKRFYEEFGMSGDEILAVLYRPVQVNL